MHPAQPGQYFPRLDLGTKAAPQTAQRFKSLSRKISASSVPSSGKTAQRNHLQQSGKGNHPACVPAAASLYKGYLSCVPSILLSVAVLPEKISCPIPAACSSVGTLPAASRHFVSKSGSLRCFPSRGIPFRTVILFSRCCPSMNYPKSTRKKCKSRLFARIAF